MGRDLIVKEFRFWRQLINFWSVLFLGFIIYDFITPDGRGNILNILATIYISALAIYVSNKEFERWYNRHRGQHPGEIFVITWSVLVAFLIIASFTFRPAYELPSAVVSSYVAVLTILAITRKSKELYQRRRS